MKLKDLKKQNEAEDKSVVNETVLNDEKKVVTETDEINTDEEDLPAFMQTGEQTPEKKEEGNDYVPLKTFKSKINKFKGEIKEKDEENERLRSERDQLMNKSTGQPQVLKRPLKEDFDTDEEFYAADDVYIDARAGEVNKRNAHQDSLTKAHDTTMSNIKKGVDDHYSRVETLCEKHSIKPETYKGADSKFRKIVEMAYPGNGDLIANGMISDIGKGSDSVVFHLGVNETAGNKFLSLLSEDQNGIKAAMYLGSLKRKLNKPGKARSGARSPGSDIKGDANVSSSSEQKKYNAAHAKGDGQLALNIKRAAKKNGADTDSW